MAETPIDPNAPPEEQEPEPVNPDAPFSLDGRDYYVTPEGILTNVDAGFDTSTDYPDLTPATAADYDAASRRRFAVDASGYVDPDKVFTGEGGAPAPEYSPEQVATQLEPLPPTYSANGNDYYLTPEGVLVNVERGFDYRADFPNLTPATKQDYQAAAHAGKRAKEVASEAAYNEAALLPRPDEDAAELDAFEAAPAETQAAVKAAVNAPVETYQREGRDFYRDADGQLKTVDAGFDVRADFPDLKPVKPEDVPFAREGQWYYKGPKGKIVTLDPSVNASKLHPELKPASAEDVRQHDLQKTYGSLGQRLQTVDESAKATVAEIASAASKEAAEAMFWGQYLHPSLRGAHRPNEYARPEDIAPSAYTADALARREANPLSAEAGTMIPDLAVELATAGAGTPAVAANRARRAARLASRLARTETRAQRLGARVANAAESAREALAPGIANRQSTRQHFANAARLAASGVVAEAGDAVISGEEFDLTDALGLWAPTQTIFEPLAGEALHKAAEGLGWAKGQARNALDSAVTRARTKRVTATLAEKDPVKAASMMRKNADAVLDSQQTALDGALETIEQQMVDAPEKLFTPSALKKSVSDNVDAQRETAAALATRLFSAANVTGRQVAFDAYDVLAAALKKEGADMFAALRQARAIIGSEIGNSALLREAADGIDTTLTDAKTWGRAAKHHAEVSGARTGDAGFTPTVRDVDARTRLAGKLEGARAMASLTGNKRLAAAVKTVDDALNVAQAVHGARSTLGDTLPDEVADLRKVLDGFPERQPKLAEELTQTLEALDLPEVWTPERVERHVVERAAGSLDAKKELDGLLAATAEGIAAMTDDVAKAKAKKALGAAKKLTGEIDAVPDAFKRVRDFDALPKTPFERVAHKVIDKATGKVASHIVGKAGSAAGYGLGHAIGGGPVAGVVGAAITGAAESYLHSHVEGAAKKFGDYMKARLRKWGKNGYSLGPLGKAGKAGAGVGALYGANELAEDDDEQQGYRAAGITGGKAGTALAMLGAAALLGGKRGKKAVQEAAHAVERGPGLTRLLDPESVSLLTPGRFKSLGEIREALTGKVADEELEHLDTLLDDAKVPTGRTERRSLGGGYWRESEKGYDATKIGHTADGRLVAFNKKDFAQGTGRHRFQAGVADEPKAAYSSEAHDAMKARGNAIQREGGFSKPEYGSHDAIEVNEKALTALATKTGKAIKALPANEQLALLDYIEGGGASTFRGLQQGRAPLAGKERYAQSLPAFESAVDHLQREGITEDIGPLWRGLHLSPEDATRLVNSKFVETGALTSTSFKPFYAYDMFANTNEAAALGHVPVVLKFEHAASAAPISGAGFSQQYGTMEREALLPKGRKFEVADVSRHDWSGTINVTLREVPKDTKAKVGFVLAGLLGLDAATKDDDDDGATEAGAAQAGIGIGGLALLYGGRGKSRLFAERLRQAAKHMPAAVREAADELIGQYTGTIGKLARWGENAGKDPLANAVYKLRNEMAERARNDAGIAELGSSWKRTGSDLEDYLKLGIERRLADAAAHLPAPRLDTPRKAVSELLEAEANIRPLADSPLHQQYPAAKVKAIADDFQKQWDALAYKFDYDAPAGLSDMERDHFATNKMAEVSNAVDETLKKYDRSWHMGKSPASYDDRLTKAAAGENVDVDQLRTDMLRGARGEVLRKHELAGAVGDYVDWKVESALAEAVDGARRRSADAGAPQTLRGRGLIVRGIADRIDDEWAAGVRVAHQVQHRDPKMLETLRKQALDYLRALDPQITNKQVQAVTNDLVDAALAGEDMAGAVDHVSDLINEGAEALEFDAGKQRYLADAFDKFEKQASRDMGFDVRHAINTYAGDLDYKDINHFVRTGEPLDPESFEYRKAANWAGDQHAKHRADITQKAEHVQAALDYAVTNKFTAPGKTWRGVLMTPEQIEAVANAPYVEAKSFMSTSADPNYPPHFVKHKKLLKARPDLVPYVFEVQQRTGVPVNPGESEVMLRAGTRFRVEKYQDNGVDKIRLVEAAEDTAVPPSEIGARFGDKALPWVAGGLLMLGSDEDDSGARQAGLGGNPAALIAAGLAALAARRKGGLGSGLGHWKIGRESINLSHAENPLAELAKAGAKPAMVDRVKARIMAAGRPLADNAITVEQHEATAAAAEALWTPAEREAIDGYQAVPEDINRQLRGLEEPNETTTREIVDLVSGLDKAVNAGAVTPGIIYRGVNLPEKAVDKIEQSSHLMAQAVLSGATNPQRATIFADAPGEHGYGRQVVFKIEQRTGVPVTGSGEEEVLLRPGSSFEIVGVGRENFAKPGERERHYDTIELREGPPIPEKSRRAFFKKHGGKLAAVGALVSLGQNEDTDEAGALQAGLGGLGAAGALGIAALLGKGGRRLMRGTADVAEHATARLASAATTIADPRLQSIRKATDAAWRTLPNDQRKAMQTYTHTSSPLKRALVDESRGIVGASDKQRLDSFREALETMAIDNPTAEAPLMRGLDMTDAQIAELLNSSEVQLQNFASTTYFPAKAGQFAVSEPAEARRFRPDSEATRPVMIVFDQVDRGTPKFPSKDLLDHPAIDDESEVILPPGAVFEPSHAEAMNFPDPDIPEGIEGLRIHMRQVGTEPAPVPPAAAGKAERWAELSPAYATLKAAEGRPLSVAQYIEQFEPDMAGHSHEVRNEFRRLAHAGLVKLEGEGDDMKASAISTASKAGRFMLSLGLGLGAGAKTLLDEDEDEDADSSEGEAEPGLDAEIQGKLDEAEQVRQAREEALDATRQKLGYLAAQSRAQMELAARSLAQPRGVSIPVESVPGITSNAGVTAFLGNFTSVRQAYEARRAVLERHERDPMALVDDLSEQYSELADNAPDMHAQVTAQTFKVSQFIRSKLPPVTGVSMSRPEGSPPSQVAMRQFALFYSAATDPSSVVQDVQNNRVRREQIDTLKQLWPETYSRLASNVLEQIGKTRPTVQQRMRLDLLFDFGPALDKAFSPTIVASLDAYRAKQAEGAGGAPGAVPQRRSQPSIVGTSATGSLAVGAAKGPSVGA